jgi:DNA-binding transcriptional MocR family regulator
VKFSFGIDWMNFDSEGDVMPPRQLPTSDALGSDSLAGVSRAISASMEERSAKGIAAGVGRLITSGRLGQGSKLPTIRELSGVLGVSPATVNQAWQALIQAGALTTRGRAGTFVSGLATREEAPRFLGLGGPLISDGIDLSRGTPDPQLLPSLAGALESVTSNKDMWVSSYFDEPVVAPLESVLRDSWPFTPECLTVVDGALDALSRIVDQVVSFGDRVVVEASAFPPLLDLLERSGAELLPVSLDEQGISLADLESALRLEPVAIFLQPRAHNPTGTSMSKLRSSELAALLASSQSWIIEDDHSGDISMAADASIGQFLPQQTIHIRSYSKSHGPDLRLAAIGGAASVIDPLINRRMLGPGWSSRLLQHLLVELLTNPDSMSTVAQARVEYAYRATHFREALIDLGLDPSPGDGINVLVPVDDEQSTLLNLAATGIRVAPGRPFFVGKGNMPAIRVTTAALPTDARQISTIATSIARAMGRAERMHSSR